MATKKTKKTTDGTPAPPNSIPEAADITDPEKSGNLLGSIMEFLHGLADKAIFDSHPFDWILHLSYRDYSSMACLKDQSFSEFMFCNIKIKVKPISTVKQGKFLLVNEKTKKEFKG